MKRKAAEAKRRLAFAADEQRHAWLPLLLRMHELVDAGIEAAVRAEERRRGVRRACRRGCSVCCRSQSDIPVFEIELVGLTWYCVEKLAGEARAAVREGLDRRAPGDRSCPFLVDAACAVHPVRPIACRLFTVFGSRCAEGEDPFHSRRDDLLAAPAGLLPRAYRAMLPFHGVTEPHDQETWLSRGLVTTLARNLPDRDWRTLARLMDSAQLPRGKSTRTPAGQTDQKGPDARRASTEACAGLAGE